MSAKQKLTPWFPEDVNPVRAGVYEKDFGSDPEYQPEYQYWDGERWHYGDDTPERTVRHVRARRMTDISPSTRPWRGLAYDPGAPS